MSKPATDWKRLRLFVAGDEKKYGSGPSVYVRAGEGTISLDDDDEVHIAVVFDVQGFSGHTAAIAAEQNRYHGSTDTALQAAYEILEEYEMERDPDYIEELQEEWGDEWNEILTETFDARFWTLSPRDAVRALEGTPAAEFIDMYDEDGEEIE